MPFSLVERPGNIGIGTYNAETAERVDHGDETLRVLGGLLRDRSWRAGSA
jgi:hypothetical protein